MEALAAAVRSDHRDGLLALWPLVVRAFCLVAAIIGWHLIVGQSIMDMFRR